MSRSFGFATVAIWMASGPGTDCHSLSQSVARRGELLLDARAHAGILEPLDELGLAAVVRPRRNEGRQLVEPGGIGVGVGGDIDARGAGALDARDDLGHQAEILDAARLQMPDLDGDVRFAADADGLLDAQS